MRKKRKARGRAERAALAAVAAEAGVEVSVDEDEGAEGAADSSADGAETAAAAAESDVAGAESSDADALLATSDADVNETASEAGSETAADADSEAGSEAEAEAETETGSEAEAGSEAGSEAEAAGETAAAADGETDADAEELDDLDDAASEGDTRPQAAQLDEATFTSLIEALLFASDKPLTIARLRQLTRIADTGRIQGALERIAAAHAESGIVLSSVSGGYSFRTHSRYSTWVQQLIQGRPVRLSRAQLETLAIVAYRQPITRPEIDQIRGVDSGATLKLLLDRNLVRILGKREEVGRPLLYGTTREFLDFFSLNDLRELPTLREFSELTEESRGVVEKMGMDAPPAAVAAVVAESQPAADSVDPTADASGAEASAGEPDPDEWPADEKTTREHPPGEDPPDEWPADEKTTREPPPMDDPSNEPPVEDPQPEDPPVEDPPVEDPPVEDPPTDDAPPEKRLGDADQPAVLDSPDADSFDHSGDGTLS